MWRDLKTCLRFCDFVHYALKLSEHQVTQFYPCFRGMNPPVGVKSSEVVDLEFVSNFRNMVVIWRKIEGQIWRIPKEGLRIC